MNSVIDLVFLRKGSNELNNHSIHPDWRLSSDHTLLTVTIPIVKEHVQSKKCMIVKDSEEEDVFVKEFIEVFKNINTSDLLNIEQLEDIILYLTTSIERTWVRRIQNLSISQSTPRAGGMHSAVET